MNENEYQSSFHSLVQRGYNQKRSGDVIVSLQTGWLSSYCTNFPREEEQFSHS